MHPDKHGQIPALVQTVWRIVAPRESLLWVTIAGIDRSRGRSIRCRQHDPAELEMDARCLFILILTIFSLRLNAQDAGPFEEQYALIQGGQLHRLSPDLFGDEVNGYTGALSFRHTDIALPGNNALPVEIGRHFAVARDALRKGHFGDWDLDIPSISGVFATGASTYGKNLGFAADLPEPDAHKRCTYFGEPPQGYPNKGLSIWMSWEYWLGTFLRVPGGQSQEVVSRHPANAAQPTDGYLYPLVTKAGWQIRCLPSLHAANLGTSEHARGEGFVAVSPDGVSYRFDWMVTRPMLSLVKRRGASVDRLFRSEIIIYPTLITDRFGNTVTLQFNPSMPWQLTRIASSDGRALSIQYDASGQRISSVSDGQRTWRYSYLGGVLSQVDNPDGSAWKFALQDLLKRWGYQTQPSCTTPGSGFETPYSGTIVHPSGATGTFTVRGTAHGRKITSPCFVQGDAQVTFRPRFWVVQSLRSKTITGPGISGALAWVYDYPAPQGSDGACATCPDTKVVVMTDPKGHVSRYTWGIVADSNEGQLLQLEEGWVAGSALRTTELQYRRFDAGPYPVALGFNYNPRADLLPSVRYSPLQVRKVTQQGAAFTWQGVSFDSLARVLTARRFSSLGPSRTDTRTYVDLPAKWVIGQIGSSVNEDTGLREFAFTYVPATGALESESRFGILHRRLSYNPDGTVAARFDAAGRRVAFANYKRGIPQQVTYPDGTSESVGVSDLGLVSWHTNAAGTTHSYSYDAMGRLASIQPPAEVGGPSTPTTLSHMQVGAPEFGLPAGHWRQTVIKGNAVSVRHFDALWRELVRWEYDAADVANTQRTTLSRWDADGRKTFHNHPVASVGGIGDALPGRSWTFDALGRETTLVEESELGPLTTRTDYLAGFQKKVVNPRGHATVYGFQAFDQPDAASIATITAPEGVTVAIPRDVFGKALSITRGGITRRYVYDANQRLCKTVEPETGATVRAYDAAGNLAWTASGLALTGTGCDQASVPDSRKISHSYDVLNRLVLTRHGDGSPSITRQYTADGLLALVGAETTSWVYGYNNRREMVDEHFTGEWTRHPMRWIRNAAGDIVRLEQDGQPPLDFSPDAFGRPRQISGFATGIRYHPSGAVAGYTLANGVAFSQSLNVRGLPASRRDAGVSWDSLTWDANGNVGSITDLQNGPAHNRSMAYDGLDRLVSAVGTWGAASYTYDAADNLRSSTVGARSLSHNFDANNRLISLTGSVNLTIEYDANGNVVRRGAQTFRFGITNRMLHADGIVSYAYDGYGRRAIFSYPKDGKQFHAYDRDGRLRFASHNTQGVTRYVYLADKLIAEVNSITGTNFVHTDALGSPVARTNVSGQVVSRTRYEPFGATVAGSTNPTGMGFTGHVNDVQTGLVYMQQRYYDPVAGQFLSVDPVTTNAGGIRHFNRYLYGENNPIKYRDPDGMAVETPWDAANVAMGAVSLVRNVASGNLVGAAVDAVGIVIDVAATAAPGVPGGAATAIQAVRGADKVGDAARAAIPKPGTGKGAVPPADRDPKRLFTRNEVAKGLEKQGGECAGCGMKLDASEAVGHHRQRHADGGKTSSENLTVVCNPCHKDVHRPD